MRDVAVFVRLVERMLVLQPVLPLPRQDADEPDPPRPRPVPDPREDLPDDMPDAG
jgi:hypothetical protein